MTVFQVFNITLERRLIKSKDGVRRKHEDSPKQDKNSCYSNRDIHKTMTRPAQRQKTISLTGHTQQMRFGDLPAYLLLKQAENWNYICYPPIQHPRNSEYGKWGK